MKILDILREDVKDERRLDLIGDRLFSAINSHFRKQDDSDEDEDGFISLGSIQDLVSSKILGPLTNHLGEINFFYHKNRKKADGEFSVGPPRELTIFYPVRITGGKVFPRSNKEYIHSVIVHELRHALDYSLSKGKAFNTKQIRSPSKVSSNLDNKGLYQRQSLEVNARASQAMLLLKKLIDDAVDANKKIDNEMLKTFIFRALDKNKLIHIFKTDNDFVKPIRLTALGQTTGQDNDFTIPLDNKGFRKLFNRLLKYAQDLLDQEKDNG